MNRIHMGLIVMMVLLSVGCSGKPKRVELPAFDAEKISAAAMTQYDKNSDGKLSGDELKAAVSLQSALSKIDTDGDGAISKAEIATRIRQWQATRLGLMTASCQVNRKNKAVTGASVTIKPEEFFGGVIPEGIPQETDVTGVVAFTNASNVDNIPGMPLGWYVVEVTSGGKTVKFGLEIAPDSEALTTGQAVFEFK